MAGLDHLNGSSHDPILWALGRVTASQEHILVEINRFHERLDDGEKRMDFHAEENIRRQSEIKEIHSLLKTSESPKSSSSERLILAVLTFAKEVLGDKRDLRRWLILLGIAWAVNKFHLPIPEEVHDAILRGSGQSE